MIKIKKLSVAQVVIFMMGIIYLVVMHSVMPNNGGSGADLPESLLVWILMLLMIATGFSFFIKRSLYFSPVLRLMIVAAAMMTLPLSWSPHADWRLDALPRLGGLWAGILLYALFLNCHFTKGQLRGVFYIIASGALIQTAYSLLGLHFPYLLPDFEQQVLHQRPFNVGVFQQRNVTGSFLAVGGGVLLYILNAPLFLYPGRRANCLRKVLAVSGIVLIYCVLMELQSRIGWLGGLCVFIGMLIMYGNKKAAPDVRLLSVLAPLTGILCGLFLMHGSISDALHQHDSSNLQRIMILRETWQMILLHPVRGWGYGSYVWEFAHYIADRTSPVDAGASVIPHPHNEVLYWWMEGGVAALAGIMLLCYAGIKLLFHSSQENRFAIIICALPLLLHTQVEYPFYQSSVHWLTFVLLLSLADEKKSTQYYSSRETVTRVNIFTISIILLAYGLSSLVALSLRNQFYLTGFELHPQNYYKRVLSLPEVGIGSERLRRVKAEALIVDYQQNNNVGQLVLFSSRAISWLETWNDADMYDNLIEVSYFLGKQAQGDSAKKEAARLFVADTRFK